MPTAAGPAVHVPPTESVTDAASALVALLPHPPLTNATSSVFAGGENEALVIVLVDAVDVPASLAVAIAGVDASSVIAT